MEATIMNTYKTYKTALMAVSVMSVSAMQAGFGQAKPDMRTKLNASESAALFTAGVAQGYIMGTGLRVGLYGFRGGPVAGLCATGLISLPAAMVAGELRHSAVEHVVRRHAYVIDPTNSKNLIRCEVTPEAESKVRTAANITNVLGYVTGGVLSFTNPILL
jgi:hypothetical protein